MMLRLSEVKTLKIYEDRGSVKSKSRIDLDRDSDLGDQQKMMIIHVVSPCLYTSVHRGVWNYIVRVIGSGIGP